MGNRPLLWVMLWNCVTWLLLLGALMGVAGAAWGLIGSLLIGVMVVIVANRRLVTTRTHGTTAGAIQ